MRHWSFNRKIALASLTVVTAFAVFAVAALAGFVLLERSFESYQSGFDNMRAISQIQVKLKDVRLVETDAILESETTLLSTYPMKTADLFKELESEISSISFRPENQTKLQFVQTLKAALSKRKEHSDQILRAAVSGDSDKALELFDFADKENQEVQELLNSTLSEFSAYEMNRTNGLKQELNGAIRNWIVWIGLLALGCVSLVPSIVHSNMNSIRRHLARSVDNLMDSAHKIEPLIQKLGVFGSKFRQGRDASTAALEQSGAAIQMLADSLINHAEDVGKTADFVAASSDETVKSQKATVSISAAFDRAQSNTDALIEKIGVYSARIEDVLQTVAGANEKTKIINDFIFQTKIISFNASVEAARAGEAGRGFSIVAEELAHLSQSSGQSAKDITTVLESGLNNVESLLRESQEDFKHLLSSNREVLEHGTLAASQCTESIEKIAQTTRDLSELIGESGQALQTQLESFATVSESLKQLNASALTETSLSASYTNSVQELTEQSDNLRGLARNLAAGVKGNTGHSLRTRMNDNSGANEMVQDFISQQGSEPETSEVNVPLLKEAEARRRRPKTLSQRRMKEKPTTQPKSLMTDSPESPVRRKA